MDSRALAGLFRKVVSPRRDWLERYSLQPPGAVPLPYELICPFTEVWGRVAGGSWGARCGSERYIDGIQTALVALQVHDWEARR